MKTLSLVAAFLLLGITASHAIDTNKTDSTKNAYILAKREIGKMLDGTAPLSYERAIFLIENAWYDNHLDKDTFTSVVHGHENIVLRIMLGNWQPPKDSVDFMGQRVDRTEDYAKALANWAIFKYMTDTVYFKAGSLHAPYSYSAADPFGSIDWTNTQVSNLDRTGQGNCFALASMFKILSDRLGSEAMLCTAPSHIYIRHADEKGTLYNVEVGSRDFPGTGTISTLTYSTTESIRNDITLRDLDNKQAVALCLVYLAKGYEHKFGTKTDGFVLDCANATLKYDDHNLNAMLLKAEVLETRLAMQHRPIAQLQSDKAFINYENLIAKLYRLGYREIPPNMKNLLIRTYTMDSVRAMQAKVYDGKTRYASLSWGMFDEAHDIKPTELYNHTVFNTVTKKIEGFTKPTNIYNSYNFDPVVFALNVDPLTAKFPNMSPYAAMNNNPIENVDLDGLQPLSVTGSGAFDYLWRTTIKIVTAQMVHFFQERHAQGLTNYQKADEAQKIAISQGRANGDGITALTKASVYAGAWWFGGGVNSLVNPVQTVKDAKQDYVDGHYILGTLAMISIVPGLGELKALDRVLSSESRALIRTVGKYENATREVAIATKSGVLSDALTIAKDLTGVVPEGATEVLGIQGIMTDKVVGYQWRSSDGIFKRIRLDHDLKVGTHINVTVGKKDYSILVNAEENVAKQIGTNEIVPKLIKNK